MFEFPVFLNYESNYEYPVSFNLGTDDYDPYYEKVVLKLPLTNNSLKDESIAPKTITNYNTVSSSSYKKVGNASRYFSGASNNYISCGDLPEWDFSGEDFTVEFWFYTSVLPTIVDWFHLIGNGDSSTGGWRILIHKNGYVNFNPYTSTGNQNYGTYDSSIKAGSWTHYAASKKGANLFLFLNGKLNRKWNWSGSLVDSSMPLRLGSTDGTNWNLSGYMNDIRITKGVARYTKSFELLNTITSKVKSPVPIVDSSFGIGKKVNYQGPVFIDNYLRPAHIGKQSISRDTQPVLTVDRRIAQIVPYNKLDRMSLLPHNPWIWYRINENSYKIDYPIFYNRALPSGWSIHKNIGVYVGGTTDNQYWSIAINPTESINTNWTFLCRLKPTTTAEDYTPSCSGTSFLYTQNQMLVYAGHGGSTTSVGVGISLGTNWSFLTIHGDSLYAPITKITASITTSTWVWVAIVVTSIKTIKHLVFSETGALLGTSSITCSSLTNVKSPHGLGSSFKHGQGYVSNAMTFMSALSNEQIVAVIKEPYKVLTPRAVI